MNKKVPMSKGDALKKALKRNPATSKQIPTTTGYVLPPDAKHFIQEDAQIAPGALFGNMTSEQMTRPALMIVQPMSRLPGTRDNVGRIYNTALGEFFDRIEIAVVVAPGENDVPRTLREQKFDKAGRPMYDYNAAVVCGSPNGVYPYANYAGVGVKSLLGPEFLGETLPDECSGCIFNSSGLCKQFFRYYVIQIMDDGRALPASMRLHGLAFDAARKLNTSLSMLGSKGEYWLYTMTTEEAGKTESTVYVPSFTPSSRVQDDEFLRYVVGLNADYRAKQERILQDAVLRVQEMRED